VVTGRHTCADARYSRFHDPSQRASRKFATQDESRVPPLCPLACRRADVRWSGERASLHGATESRSQGRRRVAVHGTEDGMHQGSQVVGSERKHATESAVLPRIPPLYFLAKRFAAGGSWIKAPIAFVRYDGNLQVCMSLKGEIDHFTKVCRSVRRTPGSLLEGYSTAGAHARWVRRVRTRRGWC
jgi:hypothetical protein